jgi:hypothetical protein
MNQRFKAVRTDRELECRAIDAGLRALGCDLRLLPDVRWCATPTSC